MSKSGCVLIGAVTIGIVLYLSAQANESHVTVSPAMSNISTASPALSTPSTETAPRDQQVFAPADADVSPSTVRSDVQVLLSALHTTTSWDDRVSAQSKFELPLLFLHRQREVTLEAQRTLDIEIAGFAAGTEIEIEAQSRHINIATYNWHHVRKSFVLPDRPCTSNAPCRIRWTFEPDGLYSDFYDLRVRDAVGNLLWEKRWPDWPDFVVLDTCDVPLRDVRDAAYTVRIFYATLFPYAQGEKHPHRQLVPDEVPAFIENDLATIVQDTWQTQFNEWGFGDPVHPDWDRDKMVEIIINDPPFALFDGLGTYAGYAYHDGRPYPRRRMWWLSSVNDFSAHDSLADGSRAIFAHEFFHLAQWNVLLSSGCATDAWLHVFIEAQGMFAPSVQHPALELMNPGVLAAGNGYLGAANRFLSLRLNTSYQHMNTDGAALYDAALYWRFLYEQYGDMAIVRVALEEMACGYDPDIVVAMPGVMDRAFQRVDGPFRTFEESFVAFSRANYALRLENGRCATADLTGCAGLHYDPRGFYTDPPLQAELTYAGTSLNYEGGIPTSFGMDFIELRLDPPVHGQPLTVTLAGEGAGARFNLQVWKLQQGREKPRAFAPVAEAVPARQSGSHTYAISLVDTAQYERLALIITRLDTDEASDPLGAYRLTVTP